MTSLREDSLAFTSSGSRSSSRDSKNRLNLPHDTQDEDLSNTDTFEAKTARIVRVRLLIALIFPVLAITGKLLSLFVGDSYFANKRNFLNVYFVKLGWFWTSLAFWAGLLMEQQIKLPDYKPRDVGAAGLRFVLATLWWALFSTWFFGAPIMDRIFTITGGQCQTTAEGTVPVISSSRQCKRLGGNWLGGHDPSGHYFLLIHATLLLVYETLPLIRASKLANKPLPGAVRPALALAALWCWMFLMTSIYFHSLLEKITGLLLGMVEVTIVYLWGVSRSYGDLLALNDLL